MLYLPMGGTGIGGGAFFVNAASWEALVPRPYQSKVQNMDLVSLLSQPEDKTLEFKRSLSSLEGALKTIVRLPIPPEALFLLESRMAQRESRASEAS